MEELFVLVLMRDKGVTFHLIKDLQVNKATQT